MSERERRGVSERKDAFETGRERRRRRENEDEICN